MQGGSEEETGRQADRQVGTEKGLDRAAARSLTSMGPLSVVKAVAMVCCMSMPWVNKTVQCKVKASTSSIKTVGYIVQGQRPLLA